VKVQEVLKMIEDAGWRLVRTRGSHRQYHHPERPGTVTVHGKPSDEVHPKTAGQHQEAGRSMNQYRYVIVIEGAPGTNFSGYVPDLPGCIATGDTLEDCEANMRGAIAFHLEGMRAAGETIPGPSAVAATVVEVPAA
jgi:predicted RNase H-like HicB family nuclease/predicted RNA binding protein YcfA (HicA-like mRNA interferase family)